ncbi:DsrE family protein [Methanoculleus sp.]|uniref:DsrE family protein n=1 Tax=Methanoculleus sp. TaxID=90427 RepID=UPI0025DB6085|nr:DsrE family protein [Methanoculleus sp.]
MTLTYRVVIHLDEAQKTPLALNNAKNIIAGLEAVEVKVVAHAGGVEGLRTDGSQATLMDLLARHGVRFVLCENTLRSRGLTAGDFPDYMETVPSGVVELVLRQAEGWYYIRP